jgi:hypothetical protein
VRSFDILVSASKKETQRGDAISAHSTSRKAEETFTHRRAHSRLAERQNIDETSLKINFSHSSSRGVINGEMISRRSLARLNDKMDCSVLSRHFPQITGDSAGFAIRHSRVQNEKNDRRLPVPFARIFIRP